MSITDKSIAKNGSWFLVTLSVVSTIFCLVYLLKKFKSKRTKENFVVLLCSFSSLTCTLFYHMYELHYWEDKSITSNRTICFVTPLVYKTTIAANRCFCNLIFAHRYKTINRRISLIAANKVYWFSIVIVVLSVLQTIFDCVSFSIYQKDTTNCFNRSLKVGIYIYSKCIYYFLLAIFQTVILVEIVKPIFNHCMRMNNTTISNDEVKSSLYRVVFSTFVFCLSDFGAIVVFFIRAYFYKMRSPMIFVVNLNINTICLMCSYDNYKTRFFPILCCFKTERGRSIANPAFELNKVQSSNTITTVTK